MLCKQTRAKVTRDDALTLLRATPCFKFKCCAAGNTTKQAHSHILADDEKFMQQNGRLPETSCNKFRASLQ
jgi:hypothetical protein